MLNNKKANILISFYYMNNDLEQIIIKNQNVNWLIDSGAFSAFNSGKNIKINDYIDWIKKFEKYLYKYFMLDVYGDEKATLENYRYMLKQNTNPIPIFTAGQDTKYIDYYYNYTDYIALGGLKLPKDKNKYCIYLNQNFIKNRKFHILGCCDTSLISFSNCYSCDSSSINNLQRYGEFDLYSNNLSKLHICKKNLLQIQNNKLATALIKKLGGTKDFFNKKTFGRNKSNSQIVNAMNYLNFSKNCKKQFNCNYFIADTGTNIKLLMNLIKNL